MQIADWIAIMKHQSMIKTKTAPSELPSVLSAARIQAFRTGIACRDALYLENPFPPARVES